MWPDFCDYRNYLLQRTHTLWMCIMSFFFIKKKNTEFLFVVSPLSKKHFGMCKNCTPRSRLSTFQHIGQSSNERIFRHNNYYYCVYTFAKRFLFRYYDVWNKYFSAILEVLQSEVVSWKSTSSWTICRSI